MVPFQASFIESWRSQGYQFILVLPLEKYGVLRPLSYDKPLNKGFTIEISETNLLQIAENYFFTMDKDPHVRVSWDQLRR